MAPVVASVETDDVGGSGTQLTVALPTGTEEGDELYVFCNVRNTGVSLAPASGFDELALVEDELTSAVYHKVATGSEPGSFVFSWTGGARGVITMARVTGGNGPEELSPGVTVASGTGDSAALIAPSVTAAGDDRLLLCQFGLQRALTSPTTPTGMTQVALVSSGSGSSALHHVTHRQDVDSGATGTRTVEVNNAGNWITQSILVVPEGEPSEGITPAPVTVDVAAGAVTVVNAVDPDVPTVVPGSDTSNLTNPTNRAGKGQRWQWWTGTRWDGVIPTSSGWRLYTDLTGSMTQGAVVDDRQNARLDVVFHDGTLWVARGHATAPRISRYLLDGGGYTADEVDVALPAGLAVSDNDSHPLIMLRSTSGRLWVARNNGDDVVIAVSDNGGDTWSSADVIEVTASGVVMLAQSSDTIVLISVQDDGDGRDARTIAQDAGDISAGEWGTESLPALPDEGLTSDDHGAATSIDGHIYAVSKTTGSESSATPLLYMMHRTPAGAWTHIDLVLASDGTANGTRPHIVGTDSTLFVSYGTSGSGARLLTIPRDTLVVPSFTTLLFEGNHADGGFPPRDIDAESGLLWLVHNRTAETIWRVWQALPAELALDAATVEATPGTVTVATGAAGIVPGAVTVEATPGTVTVAAGAVDITPDPVTVEATPGTVTVATDTPGVTFLVDTFTDTDGTLLENHTPDTGGTWEPMGFGVGTSAPGTDQVITSNVTDNANANASGPMHRNTADPGDDEYDITVDMAFRSAAQASRIHAVAWRMTPTGTANGDVDRYVFLAFGSSDPTLLEIRKVDGGTESVLEETTASLAGTTVTVRIEVRNDGATVFIDDTEVLSTDDTAITQRGRVGIATSRAAIAQNQFMDNLSGTSGDVSPGAQSVTPAPVTVEATPGTVTVVADAAEQDLTLAGPTVEAVPGTVTITTGAVDITPDAVTVEATPGTVAVATGTADITPAPVTVEAAPGTVTVTTDAVDITPDPVTVEATPGTLSLAIGLTPAAVTVEATPGTLNIGLHLDLTGATVQATPGAIAVGQGLVVFPDATTVGVTPGSLSVTTGGVDITPAAVTIDATPGSLAVALGVMLTAAAVAATPGTVEVTIGAAIITPAALIVTVTPGAVVVARGIVPASSTSAVTAGVASVSVVAQSTSTSSATEG